MGTEASDFLRADHREVENHLDKLLAALKHLSPGRVAEVNQSSGAVRSLIYAHMDEEEQIFYPALRPFADAWLPSMLKEHEDMRETGRFLEELLSGFPEPPSDRDLEELYRLGIEFHDAVQVHIVDEEDQLLKLADEHLSGEQQQSLLTAMRRAAKTSYESPGGGPT